MEKNEMQIYSIINRMKNNLIKSKNLKSKINSISKLNNSRNLIPINKNESSSNFSIFKNFIVSHSISKDISNKKEELFKNDIDSITERKTDLLNFVQFDKNYLRRILSKKNYKANEEKNNPNLLSWLNIEQNKERKIDFINYQFLLGQKKYFKRLFQHYDFQFSTCDSKGVNPYIYKDSKKYINEYSSFSGSAPILPNLKKKIFETDEINIQLMKDGSENFSNSSLKNINNIKNKKYIYKINNPTNIKIKKYNAPDLKQLKELLFEYSKRKNNNIIGKEKIIDDNYNEYLKSISSSDSEKKKNKENNISKKNNKVKIKKLKNKILLYDKADIYHNIKRININNNSNIIIQNNKLSKFKKLISNRNKNNLEFINKSCNKSIFV